MQIKRIIRKIKACNEVMKGLAHVSFSQYGEDLIVASLLEKLGIKEVTYLDIGANHPVLGSNTYNFYLRGHRGLLIEPNPVLAKEIRKKRPGDICLNIGIGFDEKTHGNFYMFHNTYNALNTFSAKEAEIRKEQGIPFYKKIEVPLVNINNIIEQHFKTPPVFMSIDVEGLDNAILRSMKLTKHKPLLLCVETVQYSSTGVAKREIDLLEYLRENGYTEYADTHANTIFVQTHLL